MSKNTGFSLDRGGTAYGSGAAGLVRVPGSTETCRVLPVFSGAPGAVRAPTR